MAGALEVLVAEGKDEVLAAEDNLDVVVVRVQVQPAMVKAGVAVPKAIPATTRMQVTRSAARSL